METINMNCFVITPIGDEKSDIRKKFTLCTLG